jgi:hypothetical protein
MLAIYDPSKASKLPNSRPQHENSMTPLFFKVVEKGVTKETPVPSALGRL